ncbi:MAG: phosphate ABC transporter permease subunit PstC [Alphaproteobacteria bacterium]
MGFVLLVLIGVAAFLIGYRKANGQMQAIKVSPAGHRGLFEGMRSQPRYHGAFVAIWALLPVLCLALAWLIWGTALIEAQVIAGLPADLQALPRGELALFLNDAHRLANGEQLVRQLSPQLQAAADLTLTAEQSWNLRYLIGVTVLGVAGLGIAQTRVAPGFAAREQVERLVHIALIASAFLAVFTTIGIVLSLIFETLRFFEKVPFMDFLFGIHWSPQTALREDQVGSSGSFGAIPLFTGTLLITFLAMIIATPIGLMSAIYLSEFSSSRMRSIVKPLLEILAGIPTVVYGFFAALTVAPWLQDAGGAMGLDVAAGSALAAGAVMGMMIIPLVSSLSDDVINAVPQSLRDGALGLGSTHAEVIRQVVLPAALPGIVGAVLLAVSRAIGETMIVVMAAGLAAKLTANPLEAVTTVTVQIVTLLVGDQEFDSAKTLAAFALGLVLFVITLALNVVALRVVQKYREQYD